MQPATVPVRLQEQVFGGPVHRTTLHAVWAGIGTGCKGDPAHGVPWRRSRDTPKKEPLSAGDFRMGLPPPAGNRTTSDRNREFVVRLTSETPGRGPL